MMKRKRQDRTYKIEKVIVCFSRKIRYNDKKKESMNMQAAVKANEDISEKTAIESLFSYLDKGIDDVEAGKLHTVDEAFQIIRDRMENENYHLKQRKHNKKGRING